MARSISAQQPPNDTEMLLDQLSKRNDGLSSSLRDTNTSSAMNGAGGDATTTKTTTFSNSSSNLWVSPPDDDVSNIYIYTVQTKRKQKPLPTKV